MIDSNSLSTCYDQTRTGDGLKGQSLHCQWPFSFALLWLQQWGPTLPATRSWMNSRTHRPNRVSLANVEVISRSEMWRLMCIAFCQMLLPLRYLSSTGPRFRYWVPSGMIDPAVVDFDVRQIAEKGFGGAEYLE